MYTQRNGRRWAIWLALFILVIGLFLELNFRFSNPAMTETQLWLAIWPYDLTGFVLVIGLLAWGSNG